MTNQQSISSSEIIGRNCHLYNDMCESAIVELADNSVDLILTDPPYNLRDYSTGNIKFSWRSDINNDIAEWDVGFDPAVFEKEFLRVLKDNGKLLAFTSYNSVNLWQEAYSKYFDYHNLFFWHKTNPVPKFKKAGFLNSCEMIVCFWNQSSSWPNAEHGIENFFESPICMGKERLKDPKHPAQKPVKLLRHLIEVSSEEEAVVLDPFMGVGSTGVAALAMNREFIGVEVDEVYFDAARNRLGNASEAVVRLDGDPVP